jgi:hypothetical protein
MAEEITKLEVIVNGKDDNGNIVHTEVVEFPQDQETISSIDVEHDGQEVKIGPPVPRPKRPRI